MADVAADIQDEGLTLVMTGLLQDGREVTATIGWGTLEEAERNYDNALKGFYERLNELDGQAAFAELQTGVKDSVRKIGKIAGRDIVLFTSTGGDPWKVPQGRLTATHHNSIEIGAGWLYACFYLGIRRAVPLDPETETTRLDTENRNIKQVAILTGAAILGAIALTVLGKRR